MTGSSYTLTTSFGRYEVTSDPDCDTCDVATDRLLAEAAIRNLAPGEAVEETHRIGNRPHKVVVRGTDPD